MGAINKFAMGTLEKRITQSADDHRESASLLKQLSVLIRRYNAVAGLGIPSPTQPQVLAIIVYDAKRAAHRIQHNH